MLNALKNSVRNCSVALSGIVKSLRTAKSTLNNPGFCQALLGLVPNVPIVFGSKSAVLRYC